MTKPVLLSSRPSPWPRGHSRTQIEVLGLGLEISSEVLGLGLGLEGQVLGLGLGLDEKVMASSKNSWPRGQHYDLLNIVYLTSIQYYNRLHKNNVTKKIREAPLFLIEYNTVLGILFHCA